MGLHHTAIPRTIEAHGHDTAADRRAPAVGEAAGTWDTGARRVVNALTIDVEEYFCYAYPGDTLSREEWAALESRAVPHTLETLKILEQHGIRATFFVLGWVVDREPHLLREIRDRGHEIGSHGFGHQLVYTQTPERFRDDVKRSIDVITDVIGEMPVGYRAPSFSINAECMWALDILAELGFVYDASIYPTRMRENGAAGLRTEPHRLPSGMWEFPAATLKIGGLRLPFGGGGYLRLYPFLITRWATHRINAGGRPAMVYLHPWELDPSPPVRPRSRLRRFQHTVNLAKTRSRLLHLCAEFDFAPIGDVLKQIEAETEQ